MRYEDDIPRYKKKSNSKAPPKSKHKHRYEPCVIEYPALWYTKEHLRGGEKQVKINGYCQVCGKIGEINLEQWYGSVYHVTGISIEPTEQTQRELNPETRTLPTFQVDDPFAKFVELGG